LVIRKIIRPGTILGCGCSRTDAPATAYKIANPSGDLTVIERSNRMIVKNADMKLTVKDSDVAIYESKEW
jgi:hypothetical protein